MESAETRCDELNQSENGVGELLLPDDLTPHTKLVLNKIYQKFDKNLRDITDNASLLFLEMMDAARRKFSVSMNVFINQQRAEMKHFIEYLLKNGADNGHVLEAVEEESHRSTDGGGTASCSGRQINYVADENDVDAVAAAVPDGRAVAGTDCCPPDPCVRQRFTNHLRELNRILENILCQQEVASSIEADHEGYDCNATECKADRPPRV